jgi:hypothetical protein
MSHKLDSCSPVLVGNVERVSGIRVNFSLKCGESSVALYEAHHLDCFPTVTVITSLSDAVNPCTSTIVFVLENGKVIEREIGRNTGGLFTSPVFTVGNVRKIFVRCKSDGTDGCSGEIHLVLSYCGINKCDCD